MAGCIEMDVPSVGIKPRQSNWHDYHYHVLVVGDVDTRKDIEPASGNFYFELPSVKPEELDLDDYDLVFLDTRGRMGVGINSVQLYAAASSKHHLYCIIGKAETFDFEIEDLIEKAGARGVVKMPLTDIKVRRILEQRIEED